MRYIPILLIFSWIVAAPGAKITYTGKFPTERPKNGNFNRPAFGAIVDVSPPAFSWWRTDARGNSFYRLQIKDINGQIVHTSEILDEPAYVPSIIFPPGKYSWTVEALTADGAFQDLRHEDEFTIAQNAIPLPWIPAKILLARVPGKHPRLLFPGEKLIEIQSELTTGLALPYKNLRHAADDGLKKDMVDPPTFGNIINKKQYSAKRTIYRKEYHAVGNTYLGGVVPMALVYLLSGEEKYGLAVKKHLLHLTSWDIGKTMAVNDPRFDEVGLKLARSLPQAYDWCYDLFSAEERLAVETVMIDLGNRLLKRMKSRDYLNTSAESHDGRIPGYLMEMAIVLAEHPEAEAWMDYGLKTALTVFPHWAGRDGGWAEGLSYALTYNDRFITPLQSVFYSTGYNIWQKPFFRKFPYFLTYCISPLAEITPFGDSEHLAITGKLDKLRSMLLFYALRNNDPGLRWWVDMIGGDAVGDMDGPSAIRTMILPDIVKPKRPEYLPNDRAFFGVGWAALHSNLTDIENDLMVLFKSSPFGPVSHSHVDQNSFAILKGGKALAIPAGERYPQHGSPFHTKYTRLTLAHNALLIDGKGQIDRNEQANGQLTEFISQPHIGYAAGEAAAAYGTPVTAYGRHVIFIRPSMILIIDDIKSARPVTVDWLMHGIEKFDIDETSQSFISHRKDERMDINLFTSGGFEFSQDNGWPIDPKEGYPMVKTDSPAKQWHFSASRRTKSDHSRIAAIMNVADKEDQPKINFKRQKNILECSVEFNTGNKAVIKINIDPDIESEFSHLADIKYIPASGETEELLIP